jgi:hypothetical protein
MVASCLSWRFPLRVHREKFAVEGAPVGSWGRRRVPVKHTSHAVGMRLEGLSHDGGNACPVVVVEDICQAINRGAYLCKTVCHCAFSALMLVRGTVIFPSLREVGLVELRYLVHDALRVGDCPMFSRADTRDCCLRNTVLLGERQVCLAPVIAVADLNSLSGSQLCMRVSHCGAQNAPALGDHIRYVLLLCSVEEMVWIAARGIVARVARAICRPLIVKEEIRNSMSGDWSVLGHHAPVSVSRASCPGPALFRVAHVDFAPESRDILLRERWVVGLEHCCVLFTRKRANPNTDHLHPGQP